MPPTIQTQSGSRAALVTWTVVSSILFVVMTVLAIFATVNANKQTEELTTLKGRYERVATEADLNGDVVTGLTAAKAAATPPSTLGLLNFATSQRDVLAGKLGGSPATVDETLTKIKTAYPTVTTNNMVSAVDGLMKVSTDQAGQITMLTEGRDALEKSLKDVNANVKTQLDAARADGAKQAADAKAARTDADTYHTSTDQLVTTLRGQMDDQAKQAQDAVNALNADKAEATRNAKKQDDQIKALQSKLRDIRVPVDQIVRQADAHVMRSAGDNLLYIDLGTGDQVTAGMSFEIYDRVLGVPKTGDPTNDEALPKGKASIEIIKVSPGSSECRIVRQTPGDTVVEGDICVNLVYDRNVKYNVMVYGNFDLDRNGTATPQDADVIRRLVTRWGGKVATQLDADTDFLVIGKVPEMPLYTQEEQDRPEIVVKMEQIKKEINDYESILAKAIEYNIPVLNQNRFLYFTGYYEQSAR